MRQEKNNRFKKYFEAFAEVSADYLVGVVASYAGFLYYEIIVTHPVCRVRFSCPTVRQKR